MPVEEVAKQLRGAAYRAARRRIIYSLPFYRIYTAIRDIPAFAAAPSHTARDVVVCGIPRSGSTLAYNLVRALLACEVDDGFFSTVAEYRRLLSSTPRLRVFKTHNYSPYIAWRIRRGKTLGVLTYRDLRDVAASLVQRGRVTVQQVASTHRLKRMANDAILYDQCPRIIRVRYEDLVEDSMPFLRTMCSELKLDVPEQKLEEIAKAHDLTTTRDRLEGMTFDKASRERYDAASGYHEHHIVDGLSGKWRTVFSASEQQVVGEQSAEYLTRFGYT